MSSQLQELLDGAKSGRWILPSSEEPNPVSLSRAIGAICSSPEIPVDLVADRFRDLIGEPQHLIFVIADGFGMNFVNTLGQDSFCRSNLALESNAVFPSSTGANLFAYGRAQWPARHGKLGWYVYLTELNERATLFPWHRTSDEVSLTDLGLDGETVFPGDPLVESFGRDRKTFIPDPIAGSIPTRAMHGSDHIVGYGELSDAVDLMAQRVSSTSEPTYSHLYWNQIDSTAHGSGTTSADTMARVHEFDSEMARLRQLVPADAAIVITADHGHADSPKNRRFRIDPADELSQMLESEPAGESRLLFFRVKDGFKDKFAQLFRDRFGEYCFLFSTDEVIELELLGPGGVSETTGTRIGDFLAVTKGAYSIEFCAEGDERMLLLESTHGGLTPAEMLVPVIIA